MYAGRYVQPFVHAHRLLLSSPPRIPEPICGGEGGHRAVTVQRQCTSAVTEMYQDAFVGSALENGTTIIQFDLRQHDFHSALGTQAKIGWRKDSYPIDVHALSTFHHPIAGLDHRIGHLASIRPQKIERLNSSRG